MKSTSRLGVGSENIMHVTVGICTCGRPELRDTLRSLAAQLLPDNVRLKVLVADNASPLSAEAIVAEQIVETRLDITHLAAPPYNISTARNTIMDAAKTEWLAFIDDDETAPPSWLSDLLRQAHEGGDAIFGPVKALYAPNTPKWMLQGDFHSTDITYASGEIVTGYSCNVLMNLSSAYLKGLRFAPDLGATGGEDTLFFSQLHKRGGRLDYAPSALLYEPVPDNRAKFSWLFQRRFRSGQTHGRLLIEQNASTRLIAIAPAFTKMAYCFLIAGATLPLNVTSKRWALRGALHLGALARLLGIKELALYAQPR